MNQPAFPNSWIGGDVKKPTQYIENGMDLRDYFAAKAMGLAYQFWLKDNYDFGFDDPTEREGLHSNMMLIAETAYEMADEMMKAREQ